MLQLLAWGPLCMDDNVGSDFYVMDFSNLIFGSRICPIIQVAAGFAVLAAGVYAAHKYAGHWVRDWGTKNENPEGNEGGGKTENVSDQNQQQIMNNQWQSVERLLEDLTHELQVLTSKIDKYDIWSLSYIQ